jgi:uncharacterized iron-regulated membrane protein
VLSLSNRLALVFAGRVVFAAAGHGAPPAEHDPRARRRAHLVLGGLFALVFALLAVNTTATVLIAVWTHRVEEAADRWIAQQPDASVTRVYTASRTMHVEVRAREVPPVDTLLDDLGGQVPDRLVIVVETTRGEFVEAGPVGG